MKVVQLDRETLGYDIDTSVLANFGEYEYYESADVENSKEYIKDADVIVFNKTKMNEELLKDAQNLKFLAITATGFDNIDLEYCKKRGIGAANVKAYSTPAVAQHTFALALYLLEKINYYDEFVKSGKYSSQSGFCNFDCLYTELEGKTWGIIGMGNIGKKVAKIAEAFGCNVIFYSASGNSTCTDYERVEFDELLGRSDFLSIHCPLSDRTRGIMNMDAFKKMKKNAILINVARGAIVNDADLAYALENNMIAGAGLDVLSKEPMEDNNPLGKIKDSTKLIITPHMAWASVESRQRCLDEVYKNIEAFVEGKERNRLDI